MRKGRQSHNFIYLLKNWMFIRHKENEDLEKRLTEVEKCLAKQYNSPSIEHV
jgi:hypothetical protein